MLRTLLVFAILIPGLVAACTNRFAALLLYVWFALFRPQEWVWIDLTAWRISLVIGVLTVVPPLLAGIMPTVMHPISLCTIAFIMASAVAQTGAVRPDLSLQWLDFIARLGLICLMIPSLTTTRRRFLLLMAVAAGSLGFHAAKAGLLSLVVGGVRFGDGLAGAFVDNNGYAVGIAMILPLLLAVAQNAEGRWTRLCFYLSVPLSAFAAISTFSRGGFLALVACGATMMWLQKRRGFILPCAIVAVLLVVSVAPIPEGYAERLTTIRTFSEVGDTSALGRLHFWQVALKIAATNPLGIGLRGFEEAYDAYDDTDGAFGRQRSVHNSHLQVLAETGFLGALSYIGMIVCCFRAAFRARRLGLDESLPEIDRRLYVTSANAIIASMVGFLVGGSFIAMALNDLLWLVAAMAATLDLLARKHVTSKEAAPVEPPPNPFGLRPATAWRS